MRMPSGNKTNLNFSWTHIIIEKQLQASENIGSEDNITLIS